MIDLLASFLPRPPEGCAPPVLGTLTDALAAGLASLPDLTQALTCMPWLHTPSTPANMVRSQVDLNIRENSFMQQLQFNHEHSR